MPIRLCLIRDIADVERLRPSSSDIILSDIPDVQVALLNKDLNVISSSPFTGRTLWEEVIEFRNELVASVDFGLLQEKGGVESEFLDSFRFSLRFLLDGYAYELLLIKKIRKKFSIDKVVFGRGFLHSGAYVLAKEKNLLDYAVKKARQIQSRIFYPAIRRVLFEVSILALWLNFNRPILALSSGSGLGGIFEGAALLSGKQDLTFLLPNRKKRLSIAGVFRWLTRLYLDKNGFAGLVLPTSRKWPSPPSQGDFILGQPILRALKAKEADKVLGNKIATQAHFLALAMSQNLSRWLGDHRRDLFVAKRVFGAIQPKLFIAQHSLNLSSCLAMEAKKRGIKSLLVSHGSHIYSEDRVAVMEWSHHSTTMFCGPFGATAIQTPAAAIFHEWLETKPEGVTTGPLIVRGSNRKTRDRMRQKLFGKNADKIILLHASTPKTPGSMRPLIYESLDEYVANISALVAAASKNPDIHVAIRFRGVPGLSASSVKQAISNYDNWSWCETGVFEDWLASSDIVVSYSSTTIEQAFLSKKPVMLFDRHQSYQHFSGKSVGLPHDDLAGVCFCNEQNLEVCVKQLLDEKPGQEVISVQSIYTAFEDSAAGSQRGLNHFLNGCLND